MIGKKRKHFVRRVYTPLIIFCSYIARTECGLGKRKTMRPAEFEKMEDHLYKWFVNARRNNAPISSEIIKEKAKQFCSQIYGQSVEFVASNGWFSNFRSRYGIKFLKISGEKLSNDSTAVQPFIEKLRKKIAEMGITYDQVYNADETALFWRKLPEETLALHNEKSAPGRKIGKERVTLLVCCNATGEHKLPLFMIGKAKNPRAFKKVNLPLGYSHTKNAWMTEQIFKNWFENSFVKEVKRYLKEKNLPAKAILLLDNATCHPQSLSDVDKDIYVMFLPPNCTALIQPMDQNAIRILKTNYRKSFLSLLLSSPTSNLPESLKNFTLKDVAFLSSNAWKNVDERVLRKCFNKILYDEEWDSDDDLPLAMLRPSSSTKIIDLLVEISPDVYNDNEITEWLNDDTDFDINEIEEEDNENSSLDENESQDPKISHSQAIVAFDSCIKYAEDQEFLSGDILKLVSLRDIAFRKRNETKLRQTNILNYFTAE